MNEVIVLKSHGEPQSISQEIWSRVKQPFRFDPRDTVDYGWVCTRYFYGRGHYLDLTTFGNKLSGSTTTIPILYHDGATWNLPIFRHRWRLYEFFVPGLSQEEVDKYIANAAFYPLTPEEKKRTEGIIQEEFGEQFEREIACLTGYMRDNIEGDSFVQFNPNNLKHREFVVLFGSELFKGEDPERFRLNNSPPQKFRPSIAIYIWENGFRPSRPKKIN